MCVLLSSFWGPPGCVFSLDRSENDIWFVGKVFGLAGLDGLGMLTFLFSGCAFICFLWLYCHILEGSLRNNC